MDLTKDQLSDLVDWLEERLEEKEADRAAWEDAARRLSTENRERGDELVALYRLHDPYGLYR